MLKYEKCIRINVILYFRSRLKPPIPSPYFHFQLPISLRKRKHSEKDILILPPPNLYACLCTYKFWLPFYFNRLMVHTHNWSFQCVLDSVPFLKNFLPASHVSHIVNFPFSGIILISIHTIISSSFKKNLGPKSICNDNFLFLLIFKKPNFLKVLSVFAFYTSSLPILSSHSYQILIRFNQTSTATPKRHVLTASTMLNPMVSS